MQSLHVGKAYMISLGFLKSVEGQNLLARILRNEVKANSNNRVTFPFSSLVEWKPGKILGALSQRVSDVLSLPRGHPQDLCVINSWQNIDILHQGNISIFASLNIDLL